MRPARAGWAKSDAPWKRQPAYPRLRVTRLPRLHLSTARDFGDCGACIHGSGTSDAQTRCPGEAALGYDPETSEDRKISSPGIMTRTVGALSTPPGTRSIHEGFARETIQTHLLLAWRRRFQSAHVTHQLPCMPLEGGSLTAKAVRFDYRSLKEEKEKGCSSRN